jgi:hypothetical protein
MPHTIGYCQPAVNLFGRICSSGRLSAHCPWALAIAYIIRSRNSRIELKCNIRRVMCNEAILPSAHADESRKGEG